MLPPIFRSSSGLPKRNHFNVRTVRYINLQQNASTEFRVLNIFGNANKILWTLSGLMRNQYPRKLFSATSIFNFYCRSRVGAITNFQRRLLTKMSSRPSKLPYPSNNFIFFHLKSNFKYAVLYRPWFHISGLSFLPFWGLTRIDRSCKLFWLLIL